MLLFVLFLLLEIIAAVAKDLSDKFDVLFGKRRISGKIHLVDLQKIL